MPETKIKSHGLRVEFGDFADLKKYGQKESMPRVEKAWNLLMSLGNEQLDNYGVPEECPLRDKWKFLCLSGITGDKKAVNLNSAARAKYLSFLFQEISWFWESLRATHPEHCECRLLLLEDLLENFRP